jgi:hypothetical protein
VDRYYRNPAPEPVTTLYNNNHGKELPYRHFTHGPALLRWRHGYQSQVIGLSGNLGFSTRPHLHLALHASATAAILTLTVVVGREDPWNQAVILGLGR